MKLLLIYTEGESKSLSITQLFLENKNIPFDTLPVRLREGAEIQQRFAAFFDTAGSEGNVLSQKAAFTHALILSSINARWLGFFAGFSWGSHLPFLVYGEAAIETIPVEFASFFRPLRTEKSLEEYIKAEKEAFEKWEAANGILKAREALLQMGIPVTGESLANIAGQGGAYEVSLFLEAGFSPDTRNKAGVPLLNLAARKGNLEILKLLVQAGAHVNIQADDRGTSAIIDSVMAKQYSLVDDLIKAGADLNIKSKDGQTALVVAVGSNDERMVEALLKAGADPDIADSMGQTARKYAALFHKNTIMTLFDMYASQKAC